jgi:hypothetical protein
MFAGKTGFERQLQEISGPGKVSFRLRPTSTTHLHLVDVDAAPVQSAMLGYYRTERTYLAGQPVLEVERAAPFEWLVPVPGTGFTPRFLLQGSVPSAVVGDWFADPPAELKIDLATPTKVEVRVLDPDGNPAPAALGTARITEGFLINWESALATDVAGRAALWLPSPKFYVYATAGTAHALALVQEATDTILSLRLEPLPTMHVRVIDADGKPVAGARAAAHEGSQGSLSRDPLQRQWDRLASGLWWSYAAMARSGADGVLEIPVFVRDGFEAKVQVYAGSQRSPAFVLRPGGETEVTVLRN